LIAKFVIFYLPNTAGRGYLIVIIHDITRLKQANEDLLNSEARFRELAESLPEVVYEIDTQATLTFCNNAAFDFFGITREEFERGINVLDYMTPEERERTITNIGRIM
jgi:PAS domain-containing protein